MFSRSHYDALRNRAGMFPRSERVRLRLTGADRLTYLHGLLTNDIAALVPGGGCYAALLTPQGRMISDMRVLELGDVVLIDLPQASGGAVRDRLEQFIFSEDVTLADVSASWDQIGVYGPAAANAVAGALGDADPRPSAEQLDRMAVNANARWKSGARDVVVARSDDYGVPGFELFVEQGAGDLPGALRASGGADVDVAAAHVCRIEAGRPEFGLDMSEDTIPLEAGIEDRAISLTKGCYVGQEIIIRVLHRGHGRVARRLVGLRGTGDRQIERGDAVKVGAREVGTVTSAADSPALRGRIALGYVHRDFVAPGTAVEVRDVPAVVSALPFTPPAAG